MLFGSAFEETNHNYNSKKQKKNVDTWLYFKDFGCLYIVKISQSLYPNQLNTHGSTFFVTTCSLLGVSYQSFSWSAFDKLLYLKVPVRRLELCCINLPTMKQKNFQHDGVTYWYMFECGIICQNTSNFSVFLKHINILMWTIIKSSCIYIIQHKVSALQ